MPDTLAASRNVKFVRVESPSSLPTPLRHQVFARRAWNALRNIRQPDDILHLNGAMTYIPADVNASHFVHSAWLRSAGHPWRRRKSLYGLYQLLVTAFNAWWEKKAYLAARRVVAVSDGVRDQLVEDCGVQAKKISVIYNGLDPLPAEAVNHSQLRKAAGLKDGAKVIFFAGEMKTGRKNLEVVLRALQRLPEHYHLVAAGGYSHRGAVAAIERLGLSDRVHLLGHRSDVRELYGGTDVFVCCSFYDPCPIVLLEAMAAAVPIISSRTVGNSGLVETSECGFVLDNESDDVSLAKHVREICENDVLRSRLSEAARQGAANLTWDKVGARYLLVYEQVVAEKQKESVGAPRPSGASRASHKNSHVADG